MVYVASCGGASSQRLQRADRQISRAQAGLQIVEALKSLVESTGDPRAETSAAASGPDHITMDSSLALKLREVDSVLPPAALERLNKHCNAAEVQERTSERTNSTELDRTAHEIADSDNAG